MKMIFFIGGLLFAQFSGLSQKLILSEKEVFDVRNDDFDIIGKYKKGLAIYFKHDEQHELLLADSLLNVSHRITINFIPSKASNIQLFSRSNDVFLFYEVKSNKVRSVFASKIGFDSTFIEPIKVLEHDLNLKTKDFKLDIIENENHSKFLVRGFNIQDHFLFVKTVVLNDALVSINKMEQIILDDNWTMTEKAVLCNNGEFYWPFIQRPSNRGYTESLKLVSGGSELSTFELMDVDLTSYAIGELNVAIHEAEGILQLAGVYATNVYNNSQGFYLAQFELASRSFVANYFTPVILALSKKGVDMKDLKFKHLSLQKDGGVEIAMEKTYQSIRTINSMNTSMTLSMGGMIDNTRTINEYYYDEISIFNFNRLGKLAWSQTILKSQMSSDDNGIFSSFGLLENPIGKAYLFNDDNLRGNRLIGAYVSSLGQLTLKELPLNQTMNNLNLLPRSARQISSTEMVMPCLAKGYLRFLKIQF